MKPALELAACFAFITLTLSACAGKKRAFADGVYEPIWRVRRVRVLAELLPRDRGVRSATRQPTSSPTMTICR